MHDNEARSAEAITKGKLFSVPLSQYPFINKGSNGYAGSPKIKMVCSSYIASSCQNLPEGYLPWLSALNVIFVSTNTALDRHVDFCLASMLKAR